MSEQQDIYDVIVIGAGGMGSAAAYHLAKDGRRVLLLEQFQLGHTRGSSHGGSRITRYTNPDVDDARVMPATYELWRTLEAERAATALGEHAGSGALQQLARQVRQGSICAPVTMVTSWREGDLLEQ